MSKKNQPQEPVEKYFEGKISIREFLVDFFGALMPGVFFLIFLVTSLIIPILVGIQSLYCLLSKSGSDFLLFPATVDFSFAFWVPVVWNIAIFFLILAFGYIIGTLYYRRDPKEPDYRSFLAITKSFTKPSELNKWVVRIRKKGQELGFIDDPKAIHRDSVEATEVQFPYNNLRGYLMARGWNELAMHINWGIEERKEGGESIIHPRSKTFINALKIRLQFHFPEHCSTIIKNEAHVRLSSSMWHVSNSLIKFSIYGALVLLISGLLIWVYSNALLVNNLLYFFIAFSMNIATLLLAIRLKSGIEKFFHYQRVREIFYVLETATTAAKSMEYGNELIFGGLLQPHAGDFHAIPTDS